MDTFSNTRNVAHVQHSRGNVNVKHLTHCVVPQSYKCTVLSPLEKLEAGSNLPVEVATKALSLGDGPPDSVRVCGSAPSG